MAGKKKAQRVTLELKGATDDTQDDELQLDPEDADILRALAEIDDSAEVKWNITRVLPIDKQGYCITVPSSDLRLDYLADKLGPGKYRVRGHHNDGTYVKHGTFVIADDVTRKSAAPASSGGSLADMLAVLEAKRSDTLQKYMPLLVVTVPSLIDKMFGTRGPQITEMVAALAGLKQLQPQEKSPLEDFIKGIELAKSLQPESPATGTTLLDMVRDVARPLLERGFTQAQPQPAIAAPIAPAAPVPESPMLKLMQWLRATLAQLIHQAKRGSDFELYAEVTLDNLPEDLPLAQLRELIAREDWWTVLQQFNPGVALYEAWFSEFRGAVLEQIDAVLAEELPAEPLPPHIPEVQP